MTQHPGYVCACNSKQPLGLRLEAAMGEAFIGTQW